MNNQQILDKAPSGATHAELYSDGQRCYFYRRVLSEATRTYKYFSYLDSTWFEKQAMLTGDLRSLADIARIVELEKALTDSQKLTLSLHEQIVSADNASIEADKARIVELEKERDESKAECDMFHETVTAFIEKLGVDTQKRYREGSKPSEIFMEYLSARDLEQQAKGIEEAISFVGVATYNPPDDPDPHAVTHNECLSGIDAYAKSLIDQAKALRGDV